MSNDSFYRLCGDITKQKASELGSNIPNSYASTKELSKMFGKSEEEAEKIEQELKDILE